MGAVLSVAVLCVHSSGDDLTYSGRLRVAMKLVGVAAAAVVPLFLLSLELGPAPKLS